MMNAIVDGKTVMAEIADMKPVTTMLLAVMALARGSLHARTIAVEIVCSQSQTLMIQMLSDCNHGMFKHLRAG
jgi:hypothetical protein